MLSSDSNIEISPCDVLTVLRKISSTKVGSFSIETLQIPKWCRTQWGQKSPSECILFLREWKHNFTVHRKCYEQYGKHKPTNRKIEHNIWMSFESHILKHRSQPCYRFVLQNYKFHSIVVGDPALRSVIFHNWNWAKANHPGANKSRADGVRLYRA